MPPGPLTTTAYSPASAWTTRVMRLRGGVVPDAAVLARVAPAGQRARPVPGVHHHRGPLHRARRANSLLSHHGASHLLVCTDGDRAAGGVVTALDIVTAWER